MSGREGVQEYSRFWSQSKFPGKLSELYKTGRSVVCSVSRKWALIFLSCNCIEISNAFQAGKFDIPIVQSTFIHSNMELMIVAASKIHNTFQKGSQEFHSYQRARFFEPNTD